MMELWYRFKIWKLKRHCKKHIKKGEEIRAYIKSLTTYELEEEAHRIQLFMKNEENIVAFQQTLKELEEA